MRGTWYRFKEHGMKCDQFIFVVDHYVADDEEWEEEVGRPPSDSMSENYWEGNPVIELLRGPLTRGRITAISRDEVLKQPHWSHLSPLKELRPLYRDLRLPGNRLRKPGGETRQDGSLVANQHRMGPLTLEAREMGLEKVLDIQRRCNIPGAPLVDILNAEEEARIRELISQKVYPNKWTGDEPLGSEPFEEHGQMSLFGQ